MTSRVEAVAKRLRERADDVFAWRDNDHGIDDQTWLQLAQAAIEASDAWLKEQEAELERVRRKHRRRPGLLGPSPSQVWLMNNPEDTEQ